MSYSHKAIRKSLRPVTSLVLVAIITLISSLGAWAAPPRQTADQDTTTPNALFGRSLYMPALGNDQKQTETLEVSVVRLGDAVFQSQIKQEDQDEQGPQTTANNALPAPLPGTEVYPAQPDMDAPGTAVAPASLDASLDTSVSLLYEDFDGTFPDSTWRVLDHDGSKNGEYYWDDDDFKPFNGKSSAWVANGGSNGLDPEFYNYPDNLQTWMIYGPFDLSDAANANFTFNYWNVSEINYDYLGWYASPDGNNFYGMRVSGNSQGWKPITLNFATVPVVGNLLGDSSVWIAFRFTSDGNTSDRGAFIDQVRVQKEINSGCEGGFKAEYFNNKDLSGHPLFTRCEKPPINQNWGDSGPGNGLGNDNFSVRWTGTFNFDKEIYNFVAIADDGVRLWLDDTQIINNWQIQNLTPNLATRQVSAGQHTLRLEYYENDGGAAAQFRWLRSDTTISDRQAFDSCFLPEPSEMQDWWSESPYYEIGIYIGGNNRGCKAHNDQYLNANWINTVRKQGWNFIPTWVGPQAPCTDKNLYTMSSDPAIAFAEGQHEAGDAAVAARSLGLTAQDLGGTIIYYDMEPYPDIAGCREVVKSFMSGWASRLHELGNQAGGYGAACASYLEDWVFASPYALDQIWPAAWIYPAYHAEASVWNVACIDNSLWSNQQRIRQYAGDHNERWGSNTLNIGSNVLRGQVAGNNPHTASNASDLALWQQLHISDMHLLTENMGWVIADGQFLWTRDGGATWDNRTPNQAQLSVRAATFRNVDNGWMVGAALPDAQGRSPLYVGQTTDGGITWQLHSLAAFNPIEPGSTQGAVTLNFLDAQTGYLQIKLASSSNFDLYSLLKTVDGGATWQEITVPNHSPVHFVDAMTGWTTATTTDAPMQLTTDGGASWHTTTTLPTSTAASTTIATDPLMTTATDMGATATTSFENGSAWAFVERGLCSGTKSPEVDAATADPFACIQYRALLSTSDGGITWLDITPTLK